MAGAAIPGRLTWLTATIADAVEENHRARTLRLDVPGWPGHRAGQHVDVRLTAEDGYQAQRQYSIASAPEADRLELTVELMEGGELSPWFVEEAQPGDQLELRGPIGGHFTWSADDGGPLLLVAGGSGLVPLMAMLRHRAARGSTAATTVLISTRSPADDLYALELDALDRTGLRIARTYTRAVPRNWTGYARRIDGDMLGEVAPAPGARVYCCGPTAFVERVLDLLVAAGHPFDRLHAERFGPT